MNIERDVPLGPLTTYRVGGPARWFARVESVDDLREVSELVRARSLPTLVVGKGSNLLVADAGFGGVAVVLGDAFAEVVMEGEGGTEGATAIVRAGGATPLPVLARRTAAAGLRGLEWAVGVPGSVGGGVRMNAGGHGSDVAASLERVRVFDLASGDHRTVQSVDLDLGYRRSAIGEGDVVLEAELTATVGSADEAGAVIDEIVRWRRENQPGGQNAGSVFTNPPDDSAGRLVDAAGCKGLRVGTAEVST
ncbi:MAG: UDP-N-acetylmuramate dehydrogenase, partial [Actinomycetota bacterium]|nr:UDP-N-acetylmuramate dehydrogenase [Actinomycetota bacterium]